MTGKQEIQTIRVLLVEDAWDDVRSTRLALPAEEGFAIDVARTAADAKEKFSRNHYDICLVDHRLPDEHGLALLRGMHEQNPAVPIVMCSGIEDDALVEDAMAAGAADFVVKSVSNGSMLQKTVRRHAGSLS